MDAEMMNPFYEPTLSQRLDEYDKRNEKKVPSPRFTEGEREAMETLIAAHTCLKSKDCANCKFYDRLCTSSWLDKISFAAIVTVRKMLSSSEIPNKCDESLGEDAKMLEGSV